MMIKLIGCASLLTALASIQARAEPPRVDDHFLARDDHHHLRGDGWKHDDHHWEGGGKVAGVPGPLAGAGLPFIAVGYGAYWLVRRYRRKSTTPSA